MAVLVIMSSEPCCMLSSGSRPTMFCVGGALECVVSSVDPHSGAFQAESQRVPSGSEHIQDFY